MIYLPLSLGLEGLAAFGDGLDHMQYVVRATGQQRVAVEGMRAVFRASDPDLPPGSVTTLDDLVTASEGERLFEAQLLAGSAPAALAPAMIGVYGVSAHPVNDRTHEIAVRMALPTPECNAISRARCCDRRAGWWTQPSNSKRRA